jgi:hypothetical protein
MKKSILFFILVCSTQTIKALTITGLSVFPTNSNDVTVQVLSMHENSYNFVESSYTIIGNTITLNICYRNGNLPVISSGYGNFILQDINLTTNNYTLIVNLYLSNYINGAYVCNYNLIKSTETLNFSTILTTTITLDNENFKETFFNLFPNPNNGSFKINGLQSYDIEIYNLLGQMAFSKLELLNDTEIVTNLKKGIYLVKIINEEGKTATQKMVVE